MTNFIITIGRQFGSGGMAVGKILSQKLSMPFYDKELINLASHESGLNKDFFEKADEQKSRRFFGNIFGFRTEGLENSAYISDDTLFQIQSDVIKNLAKKESCIIVGRCADYILRNEPNLLKIFISANINNRVCHIAMRNSCTEKEAKMLIELADKKRANYYNFYSGKTWGEAENYDLCINSSVLGIDKTADFIEKIAKEII